MVFGSFYRSQLAKSGHSKVGGNCGVRDAHSGGITYHQQIGGFTLFPVEGGRVTVFVLRTFPSLLPRVSL